MAIATWFAATLRQYPEIAIFLTLALGYYFGKFTFRGIGLGSVTATLLAGVVIGQMGITISQPLKATVFLMFLFAVGYGVGPQFVPRSCQGWYASSHFRGGPMRVLPCDPVAIVKLVHYDLGYAPLLSGITRQTRIGPPRKWLEAYHPWQLADELRPDAVPNSEQKHEEDCRFERLRDRDTHLSDDDAGQQCGSD